MYVQRVLLHIHTVACLPEYPTFFMVLFVTVHSVCVVNLERCVKAYLHVRCTIYAVTSVVGFNISKDFMRVCVDLLLCCTTYGKP